jgi:hypothetical protein
MTARSLRFQFGSAEVGHAGSPTDGKGGAVAGTSSSATSYNVRKVAFSQVQRALARSQGPCCVVARCAGGADTDAAHRYNVQ